MKKGMLLTFILIGLLPINIHASDDLERANLAKVITEIDFLLSQVEKIKHQSSDDNRIKFHYADLSKDLHKIRSGVSSYINADINNGRVVKPLTGSYR